LAIAVELRQPLSVVAGELVLVTVLADRLFGIEVTRREWIGVALTAAGLAFLAATLTRDRSGAHSRYDPTTLAIYLVALGGVGLAIGARVRRAPALAVFCRAAVGGV
jgi:drug/metabolite transporter (DMT)-like permease